MKKELLKNKEEISFTIGDEVLKYRVFDTYLSINCGNNSTIFQLLGIKSPNSFCGIHYGYSPYSGVFPECKSGDYAALTRVYNALQELCNEHNGVTKEITYEIY